MNTLFSPIKLDGLELRNRIVIPPMCMYSAGADGLAADWHLVHYGSLAVSGPGLLIFEATAVSPEGRISNRDLGLWSDETEAALADVVRRVRACAPTPLAVQLGHAGRKGGRMAFTEETIPKSEGGWDLAAPSPLSYGDGYPVPDALDAAGVRRVVLDFAAAAGRAARAGFDAVEVHAAHGYLLHQFLSPLSNRREDEYGGSLENRMRLVLEVFDAVRAAFPAGRPVGVRISGSDWADGGWNADESAILAKALESKGCAFIHVSGGGLSLRQKLRVGPGYQVGLARTVKRAVAMPVIAVGLITLPEQAETILEAGDADLVAVGRGMLYNPRWAWFAAEKLGASIAAPLQYHRARPHGRPDLFLREEG